jgi:hypothetical protein
MTRLTVGERKRILTFENGRTSKTPAPEISGCREAGWEGRSAVVSKGHEHKRTSVVEVVRPTKEPEITDQERQILQEALKYLVFKHGHLLVPTGIREERGQGDRRWIITVSLRYPTGFEGEIGDLLYDGREFTFLTPPEVRKDRARKIAEDPEGVRQWNEYRASTLPPGEG